VSLFYKTTHDLPRVVPLIKCHSVILPKCSLEIPLSLQELSEKAIKRFDIGDLVGVLQLYQDIDGKHQHYYVGCVVRVTSLKIDMEMGLFYVGVTGLCRFRLAKGAVVGRLGDYIPVDYKDYAADLYDTSPMFGLDMLQTPLFERLMSICDIFSVSEQFKISGAVSYDHMINGLTMAMPLKSCEKQMILEARNTVEKETLLNFMLMDQVVIDGEVFQPRTSH
jgi:Lon protease-like protein